MQHWQKYEATKQWDHDYVVLADTVLVPFDAANAVRLPTSATKEQKVIDFVVTQTSNTATITKDEAASCSIIRETICSRKIPEQIAEIIGVMETYNKVKI